MDDTRVQITGQPTTAGARAVATLAPLPAVGTARRGGIGRLLHKGLQGLASLRLTVVLFALSIILVFCGTLAQVDAGIWNVVGQYFRSLYVWMPLQIFFPRSLHVSGGFPFPGGWLLGSVLLVNLLAAHAVRFKATWKRSGIILLHAGLILMMVGELVTGLFAVEGSMLIYEGQSATFVTHPREPELAVMPVGTGETCEVVVVPLPLLRKDGNLIQSESLPFDVQVVDYMVNSRLCRLHGPSEWLPYDYAAWPEAPAGVQNRATAGLGARHYIAVDQPETGGVDQDKEDQPAAYVRFVQKQSGKELGTYLLAILLQEEPQYVTVDGKEYDVRLRQKRTYKPYTMHLIKFRHERYIGTDKPKDFSSRVRLTEPAKNVDREVLISMNDPLRYGGETFYQQSFLPGDKATILQVVRNPGWLMPYIAFTMVAVGMLIHFGIRLVGFLSRRAAH